MCSCFHDAYTQEKKQGITDNEAAQRWYDYLTQITSTKPDFSTFRLPESKVRRYVYNIIGTSLFENFIMSIIIANMMTMAISYEGASDTYNSVLDSINFVFTAIFICECILKLYALGVKGYFYFNWNKFDFFVVFSSIVDITVSYSTSADSSFLKSFQIIRVLRVLRVTRVLRLIKGLKGLAALMQTLQWSMKAIGNILILLLLIFCIYAIMGYYLFESISYEVNKKELKSFFSFSNFDDFYNAFRLVFICTTGEGWPFYMKELKESG